jgi:hypothetical protein
VQVTNPAAVFFVFTRMEDTFMKSIWKYQIEIIDEQTITIPKGATILSVQNQDNTTCIWALIDSNNEKIKRSVAVVGTGNPFLLNDSNYDYIGTIQSNRNYFNFVWHVFIEKETT